MNLLQNLMETDLDLLLQSDDDEVDSAATEADNHLLTVDEILLNHSSPSPPSSPRNDGYLRRRWEHTQHRDGNVFSFNRSASGAGGDTYGSRYVGGGVLQHLFGGGLMKSSSKPGAALEAAAAASRSIPTPHAVAIKSMRATAGAMRSAVSDTSAMAAVSGELLVSQSSVDSGGTQNWCDAGTDLEGLGFSESQEAGEVGFEEIQSAKIDPVSEKADPGGGDASDRVVNEAEVLTHLKTKMEVGDMDEVPQFDNGEEKCAALSFETLNATPPVENEKESVLDEVSEVTAEVFPYDTTDDDHATAQHLPVFVDIDMPYSDEHKTRGGSDFSEVVSEYGDQDYGSSPSDVSELESTQDIDRNGGKLLKNSQSPLKPLDLAEEIEKKQAYTGLHYEEGAAAQPMRLEGVTKGSVVLGYFDVNADNAISRMISPPSFRRDHGSPQVVAAHVNYIAVGMSKGTIFVVPSKYNAHHIDNMNEKMTLLGLQGDRSLVTVTSMCFNQHGDLLFTGYDDGHYTIWDLQKGSALNSHFLFFDLISDSSNARIDSEREVPKYSLDESYSEVEEKEKCKAKRKISRKRKLFAIFIKEIVEGMIGYVKLPRIMSKLPSDNGNQEFGDFELTILGMLGTYDFERKILDIANSLIQDDTYYTMSLFRKGASHGYAPRNFVCCIYNSLLVSVTPFFPKTLILMLKYSVVVM